MIKKIKVAKLRNLWWQSSFHYQIDLLIKVWKCESFCQLPSVHSSFKFHFILFYQKGCIQRRISEHLVNNIYENASILKEKKTIIILEFLQNALQFFLRSVSSSLRPATLIKTILQHSHFPVNFAQFSKTSFFTEHHRWRLL